MPQDTGASANAEQALVSDGAPSGLHPSGFDPSRAAVLEAQEGFCNDVHRVALRAGFLLCREYMARFVEQGGDTNTASSIRANWIPAFGDDPGPPRKLAWSECVTAEDMEKGPWETRDPGVCAEGAVYALGVMAELGMELPASAIEAGTVETEGLDAKHESAVPQGDAHD